MRETSYATLSLPSRRRASGPARATALSRRRGARPPLAPPHRRLERIAESDICCETCSREDALREVTLVLLLVCEGLERVGGRARLKDLVLRADEEGRQSERKAGWNEDEEREPARRVNAPSPARRSRGASLRRPRTRTGRPYRPA